MPLRFTGFYWVWWQSNNKRKRTEILHGRPLARPRRWWHVPVRLSFVFRGKTKKRSKWKKRRKKNLAAISLFSVSLYRVLPSFSSTESIRRNRSSMIYWNLKKKNIWFFFPETSHLDRLGLLGFIVILFFLTQFFLIFFIEIQKPKSQWRSDRVAATPMFRSSFVWKIPLIVARFLERPRPETQKWSNNKNKRWNQKNNRRRPSKDVVVVETWTILCFGRNPSPRWHVIEKNPPTNEKETKSKGNPNKKKNDDDNEWPTGDQSESATPHRPPIRRKNPYHPMDSVLVQSNRMTLSKNKG